MTGKEMMASIEPEQLAEYYEAYADGLALYARTWLVDDLAGEVVQEAFLKLMGQQLPLDNVKGWLYRTVRNGAITRLRKHIRWRKHKKVLMTIQPEWFESRQSDLIDARQAQAILLTLPEEQREIVLLRIWGQLSLKEIAEVVGSGISTVHSRYQRALRDIKERMQSCHSKTD